MKEINQQIFELLAKAGRVFSALFVLGPHKKASLLLLLIGFLTIAPRVTGWNDATRIAMIESVVERGTLRIDDSEFLDFTGDKIYVDEHFYSDKPLFPSAFGVIAYWPVYQLGIELGYGPNLAYYLITLLTIKLSWFFGISTFYSSLQYTGLKDKQRLHITTALALGSLYLSWSATFNNHLMSAAHMMIGFSFFLHAKYGDAPKRLPLNLFLAGLFISLAGVEELPQSLFYIGFLVLILLNPDLRRGSVYYLGSAVFTVLPTLYAYYAVTGSIIPVPLQPELYMYPGAPWYEEEHKLFETIRNQGWDFVRYSFTALFGARGFFLYNPLLFWAVPNVYREIKKKRKFYQEALVIVIVTLLIAFYYLSYTQDFSGGSYSIRWFIIFLPLFFFFLYASFEGVEDMPRNFKTVYLFAMIIALIGVFNPWSKHWLHSVPIIANIAEMQYLISRILFPG